jgi:hypothetical protein
VNTITIPTTLTGRPTIHVTADSDLMQNHQAALPVAPEDELAAVYDSNGLPIVLSFSPDGNFYAVTNSPASPTGWQQFDLSEAVRPWGTMKSFAAGQLPNGNIFLAAAVQDISDASTQNLFIAGPLDPDLTKTNWADLSSLWIKSPNKAPGTTIDRILVGSSDDGQGYGVPVVAASINTASVATISDYIVKATVDPNSGTISWNWLDFPTPTSMVNMLDYALGSFRTWAPACTCCIKGREIRTGWSSRRCQISTAATMTGSSPYRLERRRCKPHLP